MGPTSATTTAGVSSPPGSRGDADAIRLADPRALPVLRRRLHGHPRAGGPGLLRRDGGVRRHLAHRAQLHRGERVLRSHPLRQRGGRPHVADPDWLRGHPARPPPPHPDRHRARTPRQPFRRPPRHRRRVRAAQPRQPGADGRDPGGDGARVDGGAARAPGEVLSAEPARASPAPLAAPAPADLAQSGLDDAARQRLREQAALWRFVHVAESQAQAEDELTAALLETRHHMVHARATLNPPDYEVDVSRVNPWNDPRVADDVGVRYSLENATLYGTAARVAEQIAELRDTGVRHVLCQMSFGYLPQERILDSMRRFGERVMPRFR